MFSITMDNVTKKFDDKYILKNTYAEFQSGKITAIIAPNGSGKTTTINVLSGLMGVDSGKIIFSDEISKKNTAMIYGSDKNLYMKNTVEENLYYFAKLKKIKKDEIIRNIDTYKKELLDYDSIKGKLCESLLHGMKRLVAMFISLVINEKILIFDEITEGLDGDNVEKLAETLNKIKRDKIVIICSHNYKFIENIADSLYFIKDCSLIEYSGKNDIHDLYKAIYKEI